MPVQIIDEVNTRKIQMRWLKNMVLSKMFGLQCGEVRDFWRKQHHDELHFCTSYTILVACLARGE